MAVGTAIAIGAIAASAASSAYAAHKQAEAAKQAAQIQADAAGKATTAQRGELSPYTQAGGDAMNTLSRLLGAPAGSQYASGGNFTAGMPPSAAVGAGLPMGGQPGGLPPGMGQPPPQLPPSDYLPAMGGPPPSQGQQMPGGPPRMPTIPPGPGGTTMSGPQNYRSAMMAPQMGPPSGPTLDGRTPLRLEDFIAQMR